MTSIRTRLFASYAPIAIVSMALLSACTPEDKTAPAAPIIDAIASPASASAQQLSGTAEFGSTVLVSGAGPTVEIIADPYTAKWFADVVLAPGEQTISATATDAAGNVSEASTVTVNFIEPGNPATVTIKGAPRTRAGVVVPFDVHVYDDFGDEILDAAYMITTDASAGTTTPATPTDISFCELGDTKVTVSVGSAGPTASISIKVSEGIPTTLALSLSSNAVSAGTDITYTTEVLDICGNTTNDVVSVRSNAPGAAIANGAISGLVRSGNYTVIAEVPNTNAVDSEPLVVDPDKTSAIVVLQMASLSGFVGVPVGYTVTAVDGFGNSLDKTSLVITTTDSSPATIDTTTQTVTFGSVGTPNHIVTATLFGSTANRVSDAESVLVSDPDRAAPTVVVTSPIGGTTIAPGQLLVVTVTVSDDQGLAQVFLETTGADRAFKQQLVPNNPITGSPETGPVTATFLINVGRKAIGDLRLVAQAVDTSGNYSSSIAVTVVVDPAITISTATGVTVTTVAGKSLIRKPQGVTRDANGNFYVTNNDRQFPLVVKIDPTGNFLTNQSTFVASAGQNGPRGEDVLFFNDPNILNPDAFFVTTTGSGDNVYKYSTVGVLLNNNFTANGAKPFGMMIEAGNTLSIAFDNKQIRHYDATLTSNNNNPLSITDLNPVNKVWGIELFQAGCFANQFQCGDGNCIPNFQLCNGAVDCLDGSDEGLGICTPGLLTPPFTPPLYICPNTPNNNVLPNAFCDGIPNDCADNFDELNCQIYGMADFGDQDNVLSFYDSGPAAGSMSYKLNLSTGGNGNQRKPVDVAFSAGRRYLYATSAKDKVIIQIDTTQPPCGNNCPVVASGFREPWGLFFDSASGDLLVTDRGNDVLYRIGGLP